jgi:hypothetical protein
VGDSPLQRWQIAELTDYDIVRMSVAELRRVVSSSLPTQTLRLIPDRDWHDIAALRNLARKSRFTCRRQGY